MQMHKSRYFNPSIPEDVPEQAQESQRETKSVHFEKLGQGCEDLKKVAGRSVRQVAAQAKPQNSNVELIPRIFEHCIKK
jgi:hypothetical protein